MRNDYGSRDLYVVAGSTALTILLVCLGFPWYVMLAGQHFHLLPGQMTLHLAIAQLVGDLFWVGVCLVGAEVGARLRTLNVRPASPAL